MSRPSIGFAGGGTPVNWATVGSRSIVEQSASCTFPAGIFPGQRITQGMRIAPSLVS